jgi:hypothetical protein
LSKWCDVVKTEFVDRTNEPTTYVVDGLTVTYLRW